MIVHCIWVVGRSKGKGYATLLLNDCVEDAEKAGLKGVAAVTSEGNWLVGRKFFLRHNFESVAQYPPFDLAVKRFDAALLPSFSGDSEEKLSTCGKGLTVFRSDQYPYTDAAAKAELDAAEELDISAKVVELKSAEDVRRLFPSPYGVFSIVYDGKLVSYHSMAKKELVKFLYASGLKK